MANTIGVHTLADMRQMVLMYSHEIDSATGHWGSLIDAHLNEGQRQMWTNAGGIQDIHNFTTVSAQQDYALPLGTLYIERVLFDNTELVPGSVRDLHTNSPNTCYPAGYALYGKPYPRLWLLPGPPGGSFAVTLFLRRSPKDMVEDEDVPELPPQWHLAPVYWAAMQLALADGSPAAQSLSQLFTTMSRDMGGWIRNASKDAYPIAGIHNEPGSLWR